MLFVGNVDYMFQWKRKNVKGLLNDSNEINTLMEIHVKRIRL